MIQKRKSRCRTVIAMMVATAFGLANAGVVSANSITGELGNYIYSEPSDDTRAEILNLLNSETTAKQSFIHGLSMGLPIDELLQASVRNNSENGQDYYNSASGLLPQVGFVKQELYSSYPSSDVATATEVIDRFFTKNQRLAESPDWQVGGYHMMVPVSELKALSDKYTDGNYWFVTDELSTQPSASRPVFVQLFGEHNYAIINESSKINRLNVTNPSAQLPVVFVFNDVRERPISQMTQPATVENIVEDYNRYNLMATPPPEWSLREYHTMVSVQSLDTYFNLPSQADVPAERWSQLSNKISNSGIKDSYIVTVLPNDGSLSDLSNNNGSAVLNRAEEIAVAKSMGFTEVPISYYYLDQRRVAPYTLGNRGLAQAAAQAGYVTSFSSLPIGVAPSVAGFGGIGEAAEEPVVVVTPEEPPTEPETEPPTDPSPAAVNLSL